MKTAMQLSFFLANKPGVLAELGQEFAAHDINILGITVMDSVDHAVVRMVVSDPIRAQEILEERQILVIDGEVLEVELPNRPGALAIIAERLAAAKVNIDYAYGTSADGAGKKGTLYMHVSNVKKAREVIEGK